jgi:hypothetical protein
MLRNTLIMISFPSVALAHDGAHFHPHGIEPMVAILSVVLALGAGFLLGRMRK